MAKTASVASLMEAVNRSRRWESQPPQISSTGPAANRTAWKTGFQVPACHNRCTSLEVKHYNF